VLTFIVGPISAPGTPVPAPPAQPKLSVVDHQILERLRDNGLAGTWALLNALSADEASPSRSEARRLRLAYWDRLRRLLHLGLVFRHGRRSVGLNKPPPVTAHPIRRRRRPTARLVARIRSGSTDPTGASAAASATFQPVLPKQLEPTSRATTPRSTVEKSESVASREGATSNNPAKITTAEARKRLTQGEFGLLASMAAHTLGARPRGRRKRWTGWLSDREHAWRGRKVVAPGSQVGHVVVALRGQVLVEWDDPFWIEGRRRAVYRADQIRVFKDPAAILLGSMKSGVREKPSARKRESCMHNGRRPCARGKRRGRPPKPVKSAPG
jgi:hypothetical protein